MCGRDEPSWWESLLGYNRKLEERDRRTLARLNRRFKEIVSWLELWATPNTQVVITTGLEDNFSKLAYRRVIRALKKSIGGKYLTARNPVGGYEKGFYHHGADFIELHGKEANLAGGSCIQSNDGEDIDFGDGRGSLKGSLTIPELLSSIRKFRERGCRVYAWWNTQGIDERHFVNPRERTVRIYREHVLAVNKLLRKFK